MASDHLNIRIEFLDIPYMKQQGLLMYSPSTIKELKEELSHGHAVPIEGIVVYYDGRLLGEKDRVIDKRLYHVRLPSRHQTLLPQTIRQPVIAEKTVTIEDGVYMDPSVSVESEPLIGNTTIYFAFATLDSVHLLDMAHGAILSPSPYLRIGHCIVYADWERLRLLTRTVPADPNVWLYDRLRRDYGILGTSSVFGLMTAPLSEIKRYHTVILAWLKRQNWLEQEIQMVCNRPREEDEGEFDEGEDEDEDEEGEDEEGEEGEGEEEREREREREYELTEIDEYWR